jgi:effector-binding domain-containing protein
MLDQPRIIELPSRPIARIRVVVPAAEIRQCMGAAIKELMSTVAAQGVATTGAWFTHHFKPPGAVFDYEVGVPVAGVVADSGRVQMGEWPAMRVAHTVYHGPYEGLGAAWGEFQNWMCAEGHLMAGDLWEVYAAGPESGSDPAQWRTELYRPLLG